MKGATLTDKKIKDLTILMDFLELYCEKKHKTETRSPWSIAEIDNEVNLCSECTELMDYSSKRLLYCVQDPKPSCKECGIHCYAPDKRARIKDVMRYSGMRFILKGRLDYVIHYLF